MAGLTSGSVDIRCLRWRSSFYADIHRYANIANTSGSNANCDAHSHRHNDTNRYGSARVA